MTPKTRHRGRPSTPETPLSERERAFIGEYLTHFDATRAARAVGYVGRAVTVSAYKVLARPQVQAAIHGQMAERLARQGITADRVARDIDTAATLDIGELFDEHGHLRPAKDLPAFVRRAIVSIEVVKRNLTAGDGAVDTVYKIKLIDKAKMLEILAKHTGLFNDAVDTRPAVPAFALPSDTPGVSIH